MKRLMITCAALGLLAGGAHAQDEMMAGGLSLTGEAGLGLIWEGDRSLPGINYAADGDKDVDAVTHKSRANFLSKFDLKFAGSGVTDGGLTFGAGAKIEARGGQRQDNAEAVKDAEVYIGGEIWKLTVGNLDPASNMAHNLPDVGYDGLGVDDIAERADIGGAGDANVAFDLDFGIGKVQLTGATVSPRADNTTAKQKNEWGIGASFDAGPTTIALGADSGKASFDNSVKNKMVLKASVNADFGMFDGGLFYSQQEVETKETSSVAGTPGGCDTANLTGAGVCSTQTNKVTGLGLHFGVKAGEATKITAVITQQKQDDVNSRGENGLITDLDTDGAGTSTDTAAQIGSADYKARSQDQKGFGLGVTHDLGGGATVQAGVARVDFPQDEYGRTSDRTKFSVGVTMAF